MKTSLYIALILTTLYSSFTYHTPENTTAKGIRFFKGTFQEALAESQKTNKPLFIDVYATWCGACKQLKRQTFSDAAVGDYFNKNFVCLSVDGETEEGIRVRQLYNVRSYPSLLITDGNAKLLTRAEGFMKPYILINFGKRIVP